MATGAGVAGRGVAVFTTVALGVGCGVAVTAAVVSIDGLAAETEAEAAAIPVEPVDAVALGDQGEDASEEDAPPTEGDADPGLACPSPTPEPPNRAPATMMTAKMSTPAPRSRAGELRNIRITGSYEPPPAAVDAERPCGPMIPYGAQIRGPQRLLVCASALDGAAECAAAKEHALEHEEQRNREERGYRQRGQEEVELDAPLEVR